MASIDTIKEIRDVTQLSIKEIKKALDEAGGDKNGALEILKKQGTVVADKKASRSTNQGIIHSYIHGNSKVGVLLELLCETDFVARNPIFTELAHDISMHAAAMEPENVEELLGQEFIKDPAITVEELIKRAIAKLGENIKVSKFARYSI